MDRRPRFVPSRHASLAAGLGLALAACGAPVVPITDSGEPVETDTVIDSPDTFVIDDSKVPGQDTDETGLTSDTGACRFGEVADCTQVCFPAYFLGDGYCDDGVALPANFNCEVYRYDRGDCDPPDTDTAQQQGPCSYLVKFNTAAYANEISWTLSDPKGQPVAGATPGQYVEDGRVYTHPVSLADGTYEMYGKDELQDGWHGGFWTLVDARTGHEVFRGDASSLRVDFTWKVPVSCRRDAACPIDLVTRPGSDGGDGMSWQVRTERGSELQAALRAGEVAGVPVTRSFDAYKGTYTVNARDLEADGWRGGVVEARHPSGHLIGATAVRTRANEREANFTFPVDCRLAGTPAADDPGETLTPTSCATVTVETITAADGREVGWSMYEVATWRPIDTTHTPGSFEDDDEDYVFTTVADGLVYFQLLDRDAPAAGNKPASAGGDGWQGAELRVRDGVRGPILRTLTLPDGGAGGRYVRFACPAVDTDTAVETDTAPPDTSGCLPESVVDCDGLCWPKGYLGDTICDDGTQFGPDFACAELSYDGGDCPTP